MRLTILLFLAASTAYGHPPYEHAVGTVSTPDGRVEIREGYIDGIFFSDPIRFVAYSGTNIVASTDYTWNTSIVSFKKNNFHAYRFRSPFRLFASAVSRFNVSGLDNVNDFRHTAVSPLVWLWTRPVSHSVLVCSSPYQLFSSCAIVRGNPEGLQPLLDA